MNHESPENEREYSAAVRPEASPQSPWDGGAENGAPVFYPAAQYRAASAGASGAGDGRAEEQAGRGVSGGAEGGETAAAGAEAAEDDMLPSRYPQSREPWRIVPGEAAAAEAHPEGAAVTAEEPATAEAGSQGVYPIAQRIADAAAGWRARGYAGGPVAKVQESGSFFVGGGNRGVALEPPLPPPAAEKERVVPAWLNATGASAGAQSVAGQSAVGQGFGGRGLAGQNLATAALTALPGSGAEPRRRLAAVPAPAGESLQRSFERVAGRWYALQGIFDNGGRERETGTGGPRERHAPVLAVFSVAGGVGKTAIVATLGRAFSASGEKVLLTETTSHGLLPFYFGASELRPGGVRTFAPPPRSNDAPVYMLSYNIRQRAGEGTSQDWLAEQLGAHSRGMNRVLVDVPSGANWVGRLLGSLKATVLVPLRADMNSVITLAQVEAAIAGGKEGAAVEPYFVLNQFDSTLALHLDIREVLRQKLGDRLLPFVIRRSTTVPEALADGMTVLDYAPESPVAEDYRSLSGWLKAHSAPAAEEERTARWSER